MKAGVHNVVPVPVAGVALHPDPFEVEGETLVQGVPEIAHASGHVLAFLPVGQPLFEVFLLGEDIVLDHIYGFFLFFYVTLHCLLLFFLGVLHLIIDVQGHTVHHPLFLYLPLLLKPYYFPNISLLTLSS